MSMVTWLRPPSYTPYTSSTCMDSKMTTPNGAAVPSIYISPALVKPQKYSPVIRFPLILHAHVPHPSSLLCPQLFGL